MRRKAVLIAIMQLHKLLLAGLLVACSAQALAQRESRNEQYAEANLGIGSREGALALSWSHHWKSGKNGRFRIGLGVRLTTYVGQNQYYITAPAELTSGETGPQVIFAENIPENIDTLLLNSPWVTALNGSVFLTYSFTNRFHFGFNIDLIGVSLGPEEYGNFMSGISGQFVNARPSPFNLVLISDNDLGSLNSELWCRYFVNERMAIKGGLMFLFTEYTTETEVQQFPEPNDRFRLKSLMANLGVSYRLKPD